MVRKSISLVNERMQTETAAILKAAEANAGEISRLNLAYTVANVRL